MIPRAITSIQRMDGGAQAWLMAANDGHYYVVKFQNNPQHKRILVNDLISCLLLEHIGLPTAHGTVIQVDADVAANCYITYGTVRRRIVKPGSHFGSRYPGDPAQTPVYEFLPDFLMRQLRLEPFFGILAFDKWVSNADGRQAIFFRKDGRFQTLMIDHGFAFQAHAWSFHNHPWIGLYPRPWIYDAITGYDSFDPWLTAIRELKLDVLYRAFGQVPLEWYDSNLAEFGRLLETLYAHRKHVPELIRHSQWGGRDAFPRWTPRMGVSS